MPKETAKREREMDEDNAGKAEEVEEGDKRETKTRESFEQGTQRKPREEGKSSLMER